MKDTIPCRHPKSAVVSSDEGTHYCEACQKEAEQQSGPNRPVIVKFVCGHVAIDPDRQRRQYICPECGKAQKIARIESPCETPGCDRPAIGTYRRVRFCDICRAERARKRRNANGKRYAAEIRRLTKNMQQNDDIAMTFQEIANELGSSVQNAQQITKTALLKFKKHWEEAYGSYE